MADARLCAVLLGGSALLTAAGLWGAGMGKVFRMLGVVLMVMFSSAGSSLFSAMTRGGGIMGLTSPSAAELITRNDNPVATEKEFADYFEQARKAPIPLKLEKITEDAVPKVPAVRPAGAAPLAADMRVPQAMAP